MSDATKIPDAVVIQIGKLEMRGGDVLVVKIPHHIEATILDRWGAKLKQIIPDGCGIMFIEHDTELSVLTKAEAAAAQGKH